MARVDFKNLDNVIKDPSAENRLAKDSGICLSQFVYLLSNFTKSIDDFTEADLALITKAFQQFLNRRTFTYCRNKINIGEIYNVDFGMNYEPEMSYNHPALILDMIGDLVLVLPTSTSSKKIDSAYHPIDNPNGNWYYYKVGCKEGFAETCALILGNVCTISQGRLLECKGKLKEDITKQNSLYNNLRNILITNIFKNECEIKDTEINYYKSEIERLEKENELLKRK